MMALSPVWRLALCWSTFLLTASAFSSVTFNADTKIRPPSSSLYASSSSSPAMVDRRRVMSSILATAMIGTTTSLLTPASPAAAAAEVMPEMKNFVDPLFVIKVPKTYFTIRRSAKGDLPNEATGKGRRGSSIFTAGDLAKAEVVAVERFPTRLLLEENGMEATGDLSTFPALGEPAAVAQLISARRERDKPGQSSKNTVSLGSPTLSDNGKVLRFELKTEIEVQKPDLLMEQYGVSRLFRITVAKASLEANDGNLMAVFASALEKDFDGPDGLALREAVDSFTVLDQSSAAPS